MAPSSPNPFADPPEIDSGFGATSQSHVVHILAHRSINKRTVYLVRLRRQTDQTHTFFLKTAVDFVALLEKLQQDLDLQVWGEVSEITAVPDVPKLGHFGFRRAMSKLGISDFLDTVGQQIQTSMDELMSQITSSNLDPTLTEFFTERAEDETAIADWVLTLRSPVNLLSLMGFWRLDGSKRTWTVYGDGTAHLDGRHRGDAFDFIESGCPDSMERTIWRKDGWCVDLDTSTKNKLVWLSDIGQTLNWYRVEKTEAQLALQRVAEAKAEQQLLKDKQVKKQRDKEKEQIRSIILQRAATRRLEKAGEEEEVRRQATATSNVEGGDEDKEAAGKAGLGKLSPRSDPSTADEEQSQKAEQ